jgi:hypothetical protein
MLFSSHQPAITHQEALHQTAQSRTYENATRREMNAYMSLGLAIIMETGSLSLRILYRASSTSSPQDSSISSVSPITCSRHVLLLWVGSTGQVPLSSNITVDETRPVCLITTIPMGEAMSSRGFERFSFRMSLRQLPILHLWHHGAEIAASLVRRTTAAYLLLSF